MKKLLYQEVFEAIETRIKDKTYQINDKLPSEKELAAAFSVSAITIKRALTELKEAGYVSRKPKEGTIVISDSPNPKTAAETKKAPLIGLIVTNFDDTFGTGILNGILEEKATNVNLIVKKSLGDPQKEDRLIQELLELNISGLILLPASSQYLSPTILDLASQQFPMVMIDRTLDKLPISSITTNNVEAAKTLTTFLIEAGHKNIGLLTSENLVSSVEERIQGYMEAHAANKVTMDDSLKGSFIASVVPAAAGTMEEDIENIASFIEAHPQMTALIATEYNIALLIKQACQKIGKNIPQDLSVACFDHPSSYFDKSAFVFTHIEQQQFAIGQQSLNQILLQIKDPSNITKALIDGSLITGDSTKKC